MDNSKKSSENRLVVPKTADELSDFKSVPTHDDLTILYDEWASTYDKVK